jgi:hypothetical protein
MNEITPSLVGFIVAGALIIIISVAALFDEIIKLFQDIFGRRERQ